MLCLSLRPCRHAVVRQFPTVDHTPDRRRGVPVGLDRLQTHLLPLLLLQALLLGPVGRHVSGKMFRSLFPF